MTTLERLKNTVRVFSDMIMRGGELRPSLSAPEPVKEKFPDFKKLDAAVSRVHQLTDGNQTGEASRGKAE